MWFSSLHPIPIYLLPSEKYYDIMVDVISFPSMQIFFLKKTIIIGTVKRSE